MATKGEKVKFSNLFKHPEVVRSLVKFHPLMWLKLKMTSRLFSWRLEDSSFAGMLPYLNEELGLTDPHLSVHDLAAKGDLDSIWLLLLQGLSVRQRCPFNNATLLQKAIHSGKIPLIMMLLIKGANSNVKGAYGYTALHECAYVGTAQICQLLLQYKANVDSISKNGSTPLLVAAREGHQDICEVLLANGAHPDDGGDKGWTPLFIAAGEGHFGVVQTLLHYGANPHETSLQEGKTPAEEAYANKHDNLAMFLEQQMRPKQPLEDQYHLLQAQQCKQRLAQLEAEREQIKLQSQTPGIDHETLLHLGKLKQENELKQQQVHHLLMQQVSTMAQNAGYEMQWAAAGGEVASNNSNSNSQSSPDDTSAPDLGSVKQAALAGDGFYTPSHEIAEDTAVVYQEAE